MGRARLRGFALTASLALTGLACAVPTAQAVPMAKAPAAKHKPKPPPPPPPSPCPTPRSFPSSHLPGVPWGQAMLNFTPAWTHTRGAASRSRWWTVA